MKKAYKYIILIFLLILAKLISAQQGQISVSRIEAMPDQPSPYLMRDWKNVAIKYDSFIYDKIEADNFFL
jgi:hypothetical protein